jgi:hypothetical protein
MSADKRKDGKLTATKLRILLSLTLLLIVAGAVGGFYYARTILSQYAVEVSHKKVDAEASSGNISALQKLKEELANDQDVIAKAKLLKSDSEFPEFDIVEDVTKYANRNGLSIASFDFGDGNSGATGSTGTTPAPTPGAAPGTTTPGTQSKVSGNTVSISVTLKTPVNYANLLQFMHDLDQNLPKLKLQGIGLSGGAKSSSDVSVQPIVIQMYTRLPS